MISLVRDSLNAAWRADNRHGFRLARVLIPIVDSLREWKRNLPAAASQYVDRKSETSDCGYSY